MTRTRENAELGDIATVDASGNLTLTDDLTVTGNISFGTIDEVPLATLATDAVGLQTSRTITLTGDVTGSTSFDGTANVSITCTIPGTTTYSETVLYDNSIGLSSGTVTLSDNIANYDALCIVTNHNNFYSITKEPHIFPKNVINMGGSFECTGRPHSSSNGGVRITFDTAAINITNSYEGSRIMRVVGINY